MNKYCDIKENEANKRRLKQEKENDILDLY